jgi:hypothetical protein
VIVCAGRKPGGRAEALPHRRVSGAWELAHEYL